MTAPVLCWLDLETTGLDPDDDHEILELALQVDGGPVHSWVLHFDLGTYEACGGVIDTNVREMHTASGLFAACRHARYRTAEVESAAIVALCGYDSEPLQLAGNSVWFDRMFLRHYMPQLEKRFHYRMLDVSSVALFAESFGIPRPESPSVHRAGPDIERSQRMLRYYRERLAAVGASADPGGEGGGAK